MINSLVHINMDSIEVIKNLYGIGPILAKRIVEYRDKHGYLQCPEDLAKIDGISIELAITLAPHIDWSYPQQLITEKKRDWGMAIGVAIGLIVGIFCIFPKANCFTALHTSVLRFKLGYKDEWVYIWINISVILSIIISMLFSIFIIYISLTKSTWLKAKISKILLILGIVYIISAISCGLGNMVRYQFFSSNGWLEFLHNQKAILGTLGYIFFLCYIYPIFVYWLNPSLITKIRLIKIYNIIYISFALAISIVGFFMKEYGVIFSVYMLFCGLSILFYGSISIYNNDSIFHEILKLYCVKEKTSPDSSSWLTWLNIRLPNVEQQKALKKALDEVYPPSKKRTILSIIIIGLGGWITVQSANSILDWFIQSWLNKTIFWFK